MGHTMPLIDAMPSRCGSVPQSERPQATSDGMWTIDTADHCSALADANPTEGG